MENDLDTALSYAQITEMVQRYVKIEGGGGKNKQGTSFAGGRAEITVPITDRLDFTVNAAGYYADGDWGHAKAVTNKGIGITYKF